MQKRNYVIAVYLLLAIFIGGCEQKVKTAVTAVTIPEGEKDPSVWGKMYQLHYDSYLKNKEHGEDERLQQI